MVSQFFRERGEYMKKFISNIIYAALLVFLLYGGSQYYQVLRITAGRTFHPIPVVVFSSIFPIIIGIYLAIPSFFSKVRRQGMWEVDWSKLTILGTVSLLLAITPILYFLSPIGQNVPWLVVWLIDFSQGYTIAGVVFGYMILSVPKKINKSEKHNTAIF